MAGEWIPVVKIETPMEANIHKNRDVFGVVYYVIQLNNQRCEQRISQKLFIGRNMTLKESISQDRVTY